MTRLSAEESGAVMARFLGGSWRPECGKISSAELDLISDQLLRSGCAPLGWWRLRYSELAGSAAGVRFREAYLSSRLRVRLNQEHLCTVVSLLRAAGIEAVLVKGWAIARHYPDPALRPYGDIDLCVRPDQFTQARALLDELAATTGHYVDLHEGFDYVGAGNVEPGWTADGRRKPAAVTGRRSPVSRWDEIFARTELVPCGQTMIRVPGEADHLRILCQHFLRSGGWRPLWLVDVAMMIENGNGAGDRRRATGDGRNMTVVRQRSAVASLAAHWVKVVVALAHELLGAESIRDTPSAIQNSPRWLKSAVLRQWGRCQNPSTQPPTLPALLKLRAQPREFLGEIYARWDHPIRSTAEMNGRFNRWPRAPYQVIDQLKRLRAELPKQLVALFKTGDRRRTTVKRSKAGADFQSAIRDAPWRGRQFSQSLVSQFAIPDSKCSDL